jgi:hypothetical protein
MSLVAGTRLGPYEIQSAISAGRVGAVYNVRDTSPDRPDASASRPDISFDLDDDPFLATSACQRGAR